MGVCTQHTLDRHCGYGLFVIIHTAEILLMYKGHSIKLPAPYADKFGETLRDKRRGRPMFLDTTRFQNLRQLWATHGMTTVITRQRLTAGRVIIYNYY